MINTAKYFALLENLTLKHALSKSQDAECKKETEDAYLERNLSFLQRFVPLELRQQLEQLCQHVEYGEKYAADIDMAGTMSGYIIRLWYVLDTLCREINFQSDAKEDLISLAHLKLCIQATQELSYYALRRQLHQDFYKSPAFKDVTPDPAPRQSSLLLLSIQLFLRLLPIRQFHIANSMELLLRDLLAAIISLRGQELPEQQQSQLERALVYLWEYESKPDFVRHVLLFKGIPQLCPPLSKLLHKQLLQLLQRPQGFVSLLGALQAAAGQDVDSTRQTEIVANIVTQRGYSRRMQSNLIRQIFDYCRLPLQDVSTGVLSLRRLNDLNESNAMEIAEILSSHWQPLTVPEDLLSGLIIWEESELSSMLQLWQSLFLNSSVACLPSELLVAKLPLLLQLYGQLPDTLAEHQILNRLVCCCLDNRERVEELPELLQRLFTWQLKGECTWSGLHNRVQVDASPAGVTLKVAPCQQQEQLQPAPILAKLLLAGNNAPLTCNVFLALLSLLVEQQREEQPTPTLDLLSTESELAEFLQQQYQLKLQLLQALDQLVWHEPLKAQLAESQASKQFVGLVIQLLAEHTKEDQQIERDQLIIVMLMLLLEILERSEQLQLADSTRRLEQPLQRLARHSQNELVKNAVQPLLQLLNGGGGAGGNQAKPSGRSAFQTARELIEQRQPHLQVYGIQMMLEALRQRNVEFTSQCPRILALALSTLKSKESYTFLNCVRLFVALVHIMEAQVLDMLSAEYLAETAELDYRLVVGEAVLKAAQELGALCYRYKDVLLNCFLAGARSAQQEFRASAYANLAQLCRLVTYQVHSYFQELLQLIDEELSRGNYLPAKRGALLVLCELLEGMQSLLDYQEQLLPIYRLLRVIEAGEDYDTQLRQHAANGLKIINEKCRELLNVDPAEHLTKEIKVLGIKEHAVTTTKGKHIWELN